MVCDRPTVALLLQKFGEEVGWLKKKPAGLTVQLNKGYKYEMVEESPRQG
jgi:hypothetical protein